MAIGRTTRLPRFALRGSPQRRLRTMANRARATYRQPRRRSSCRTAGADCPRLDRRSALLTLTPSEVSRLAGYSKPAADGWVRSRLALRRVPTSWAMVRCRHEQLNRSWLHARVELQPLGSPAAGRDRAFDAVVPGAAAKAEHRVVVAAVAVMSCNPRPRDVPRRCAGHVPRHHRVGTLNPGRVAATRSRESRRRGQKPTCGGKRDARCSARRQSPRVACSQPRYSSMNPSPEGCAISRVFETHAVRSAGLGGTFVSNRHR